MGLSLVPSASGAGMGCAWVPSAGQLSEARTSGCATAYENTIIFAGGHNNSAAYVGTVDIFARETAFGADGRGAVGAVAPPRKGQRKLLNRRRRHPNGSGTAGVTRTKTFQLPTGRELLGCASAGNVTVFAGGKPPHPPAPFGETDEVDVWHHDTQTWSNVRTNRGMRTRRGMRWRIRTSGASVACRACVRVEHAYIRRETRTRRGMRWRIRTSRASVACRAYMCNHQVWRGVQPPIPTKAFVHCVCRHLFLIFGSTKD